MSVHQPGKSSVGRPDPDEVRHCHEAGMSRNRTATALGVSTRQVDNVAAELGLSWSSASTAEAVAARKAQAEGQRVELAELWLKLAVDSVGRALAEDDPGDRRRHAMTAESATRSEINIWSSLAPNTEKDTAAESFAELLIGLRKGFTLLDDLTVDDLDPKGEFDYYGTPAEEPP